MVDDVALGAPEGRPRAERIKMESEGMGSGGKKWQSKKQ